MKATVFCRTTAKGIQSFFVKANGKDYYLFQQAFRVSNKEYFAKGVSVDSLGKYDGVRSAAVRKTLDKLPSYIRYVEKECDLGIYEKDKKEQRNKKKTPYKRTNFKIEDYMWDVA